MAKKNIKLDLSDEERSNLRREKIRISEIKNFASDELEELMKTNSKRAREILALIEFQQIPSIGI